MSLVHTRVIVHDDATLGKGVEGDPIRRALTLYTADGRHVLTVDPTSWTLAEVGDLGALMQGADS